MEQWQCCISLGSRKVLSKDEDPDPMVFPTFFPVDLPGWLLEFLIESLELRPETAASTKARAENWRFWTRVQDDPKSSSSQENLHHVD